MFWMLGAAIGLKLATGQMKGAVNRATAAANNRIEEVNAETSNRLRIAKNAEDASHKNLGRWAQSVNNNRQLDAGGAALEANVVNQLRGEDAAMRASFSDSIRAAEQEGASAAAAAASGVDGGIVDMINGSVVLRDSIVRQRVEDVADMRRYDAAVRAGSIMSQMAGGLDSSLLLNTLDHNISTANKTYAASSGQQLFNDSLEAMPMIASALGSAMGGGKKADSGSTGFKWKSMADSNGSYLKIGDAGSIDSAAEGSAWKSNESLYDFKGFGGESGRSGSSGSFWSNTSWRVR